MQTITATDAKNRLGEALAALDRDSLLIERNGKPAAMVFQAEDGVKLVLASYAHGTISRASAMKMLGYDWYGQLIDAMAELGIARPRADPMDRKQMVSAMQKILRRR